MHHAARARRIAVASGRHVRDGLRRYQSLLHPLLLLHPAVLEPDLHLRLVELQGGRDLYPPGPGEVLVEVELLFELRELLVGEVGPAGVEAVEAQHARVQRGIVQTG